MQIPQIMSINWYNLCKMNIWYSSYIDLATMTSIDSRRKLFRIRWVSDDLNDWLVCQRLRCQASLDRFFALFNDSYVWARFRSTLGGGYGSASSYRVIGEEMRERKCLNTCIVSDARLLFNGLRLDLNLLVNLPTSVFRFANSISSRNPGISDSPRLFKTSGADA